MAVSRNLIDEIQEKANIVELVRQYIPLKKQGKNFIGLCPFHNEKTPSFSVSEEKNLFYCFGCHESGNVYHFLMKYKNLTFYESLLELGDYVGIDVKSQSRYKEKDEFQFLLSIFKKAAEIYSDSLNIEHIGTLGLNYLEKRSINPEMIKQFNLGYAPNEWTYTVRQLSKSQFSLESQLKSSLVLRGKNQKIYDYFRHRIIFPIYDELSRIVAFGGRVLDDSNPKYLNSPENYYFKKREILYGLNWAKESINEHKKVLVVEGYFDVIAGHQMGIKNLVAPLGTGLTDRHIQKLKRYTDTIVLIFDGDAAGEKAMIRSLTYTLNSDMNTQVVSLPENLDPCDYIFQYGRDSFLELVSKAKSALEFRVDWGFNQNPIENDYQKRQYLNELYVFLNGLGSEVQKEGALKRASNHLEVSDRAIMKDFLKFQTGPKALKPKKKKEEKLLSQQYRTEKYLLFTLLTKTELFDNFKNKISLDLFKAPFCSKLFKTMCSTFEEKGALDLHHVLDQLEDNEKAEVLEEQFNEKYQLETVQIIQDCINKLKLNRIQEKKTKVLREINMAQEESEMDESELLEEFQFLQNETTKLLQRERLHGRTDINI